MSNRTTNIDLTKRNDKHLPYELSVSGNQPLLLTRNELDEIFWLILEEKLKQRNRKLN